MNLWNHSQHDNKAAYTPSNQIIIKMRSAIEYHPELSNIIFTYEILGIPQSLAVAYDKMYHGTKSDIKKRFVSQKEVSLIPTRSKSAIVIEMAPLIHSMSFIESSSFSDFALILYRQVIKLARGYQRIDIVFDQYFERSLKNSTRETRGVGSRYIFDDNTPIPNNMQSDFLKNNENKTDLNLYLARKLISFHSDEKLLIVPFNNTVIHSLDTDDDINDDCISMTNCQSEEADQRNVRHVLHCLRKGYKRVVVRTVDTDVLILLISYVSQYVDTLDEQNPEIYANMDSRNHSDIYNITEVTQTLGKYICMALPFFCAFTDCDTVSGFYGKGKCEAWDK